MSEDGNKTLKRCPSCGGVAEYDNDSYGGWVSCESCGIRTSGYSWGSHSCIYDEWNNQPERERIEKEKEKSDSWCVDIFNDFSSDEIDGMSPSIIGAWKRGELLSKPNKGNDDD